MDDSAPRRLIIPDQFAANSAAYQLSPAEWLRPEAILARISFEGPGIVAATVTYADPALLNFSEFAVMGTLPTLVEGLGGTHTVFFTFGVTVGANLTYVPRDIPIHPPADSIFDATVLTEGLPDTVLGPTQIIRVEAGGVTPDDLDLAAVLETVAIWAEVVDQGAGADVVPPYTPESYSLQSSGAAA